MSKIFETEIIVPDALAEQAGAKQISVKCKSTRLAQDGKTIGTLWVANCTSSGVEAYANAMRGQIEKAARRHTDTKVLSVMFCDEYQEYVDAGVFSPSK